MDDVDARRLYEAHPLSHDDLYHGVEVGKGEHAALGDTGFGAEEVALIPRGAVDEDSLVPKITDEAKCLGSYPRFFLDLEAPLPILAT